MAGSVRFTKEERLWLLGWIKPALDAEREGGTKRDVRVATAVVDKLEKSELVKKRRPEPGLGWRAAYEAMKGVLGPRLVLPPSVTGEWIGRMSSRIRVLGLTEEHCRTVAHNVSGWRGVIAFERLVQGADRYLHAPPDLNSVAKTAPLEMEGL